MVMENPLFITYCLVYFPLIVLSSSLILYGWITCMILKNVIQIWSGCGFGRSNLLSQTKPATQIFSLLHMVIWLSMHNKIIQLRVFGKCQFQFCSFSLNFAFSVASHCFPPLPTKSYAKMHQPSLDDTFKNFISLSKFKSETDPFLYGLLWSFLGLLLFIIYILTVGPITYSHSHQYHIKANDTHMYFALNPS